MNDFKEKRKKFFLKLIIISIVSLFIAHSLFSAPSLGYDSSKNEVTLSNTNYKKVSVAADFNKWNKASMKKVKNIWVLPQQLDEGVYQYVLYIDGIANDTDFVIVEAPVKSANAPVPKAAVIENIAKAETVPVPKVAKIEGLTEAETTVVVNPAPSPTATGGTNTVHISASFPNAKNSVNIAGTFNGWDITANPMLKGKKGNRSVNLKIAPGHYEYKYIIDGEWQKGNNKTMYVYKKKDGSLSWSAGRKAKTTGRHTQISNKKKIKIIYTGAPNASKVSIAGSFNNWKPNKLLLKKNDNGQWQIDLPIKPGNYEYKYIIDGNWQNGSNKKMKIVRAQSGGLKIVTPKPISNTPANAKVFISGDFYFHYNLISDYDTNGVYSSFSIKKPMELFDLSFNAKVNNKVRSFMTFQFKDTENNYSSSIVKSGISADIGDNANILLFYKYPFYTYTRVLNPWKRLINDRIVYNDSINYFDETPANSYKIGAQLSGLSAKINLENTPISFIYAADANSIEDYIFSTADKNLGNLNLGITFMSYRGGHWSNAQADNWYHAGKDDLNGQESWYQVFSYENNYQTDMYYSFKNGLLSPFAAIRYSNKYLQSIYWNQRIGKNINLYKKWNLEKEKTALIGLNSKYRFLEMEFNLKSVSTSLGPLYRSEYGVDKMGYLSYKFKTTVTRAPFSFDLSYFQTSFDNFNEYKHYYRDDNNRSLGLDSYNYTGIALLSTTALRKIFFDAAYDLSAIRFSLKNKYYIYSVFNGASAKTLESVFRVTYPGYSYNIIANIRYKMLNLSQDFNYSFISPFIGVKINATHNFSLLVGYGYSPYIFTDYSAYFYDGLPYEITDAFNNGTSNNDMKNLYDAERAIEWNHIITVTGKIKF